MINEKFLSAIGFVKAADKNLPYWYSIFDEVATELKCPTFVFDAQREFYVTIYFSPKGPFAEVASNDWEFDRSLWYERIVSPEDVISCIECHLQMDLSWAPEI